MKIVYKFYEGPTKVELIEEVTKENPIEVDKALFPVYFMNQLKGKSSGDSFSFMMKAKNGFGEIDMDKIQDMPLEHFLVNGEIPEEFIIGNFIEIYDEQDEAKLAIILEISGNVVKLDFNHPLAGIDVYVEGEVVA